MITYTIEKNGQWYELRFHGREKYPPDGMVIRARTKGRMVILKRALEERQITRDDFRKYVESDANENVKVRSVPLAEARKDALGYAIITMQNLGIRPPSGIQEEYGRVFAGLAKPALKLRIAYGRAVR